MKLPACPAVHVLVVNEHDHPVRRGDTLGHRHLHMKNPRQSRRTTGRNENSLVRYIIGARTVEEHSDYWIVR